MESGDQQETVRKKCQHESNQQWRKLKWIFISFIVGTAATEPLYVAFPIGTSLLRKGASLLNVSIFLCVWASIKITMILFEIKFLGFDFAGLRLALTIPCIVAISLLLNMILNRSINHEKI